MSKKTKVLFRPDLEAIEQYVPGKGIDEVKRELGLKKIVKLASNEVYYQPFPSARKAITASISGLNRYPDSDSHDLRAALAKKYRKYGVGPENILIGNGSNELVRILAEITCASGDNIVMPAPSFVVYKEVAKLFGAKPVEVPLKDDRLDLPAMCKAVNDRTKVVFICNPNNPTGGIVSRSEVRRALKGLPKDVLIVFDEAYHEFVTDKEYESGIEHFSPNKNIVVLRTFSKVYGLAGLRIGYGFADAKVVALASKVREPFNVNTLAQAAAVASLAESAELKKRIKDNAANRKQVLSELDLMGVSFVPPAANFVLIDVGRDATEVTNKLLRLGVIIRNGKPLGYPHHIRVTFGSPPENKAFLQALKKVLDK